MKAIGNILKVLVALAAIAGAVYVIVKYGDQIVAWTKKTVNKYFPCCCCCEEEVVAEEATVEEQAAAEDFVEETE